MTKTVASFELEKEAWDQGYDFIGFDEAGYGCGAGSMFIATVTFPKYTKLEGIVAKIKDSKKCSEELRTELAAWIKANSSWKVFEVTAQEIDEQNAHALRFRDAQEWLALQPPAVSCFDGNKALIASQHENKCCIKGDAKSVTIAAASILAKNAKDEEVKKLDILYPGYFFSEHSGYIVKKHVDSIKALGFCQIHRTKYFKKALATP